MHYFLRSVGFASLMDRKALKHVMTLTLADPTRQITLSVAEDLNGTVNRITRIERDFLVGTASTAGFAAVGSFEDDGSFVSDYYYPYIRSNSFQTEEEVAVNRRMDSEACTGMCDDARFGISLIFYLQNSVEFLASDRHYNESDPESVPVALAALASSAKVLLPISKDPAQLRYAREQSEKRSRLFTDARNGVQEAIDSLTISDIDDYARVTRRARREDIYSIVDSTFIPYGSESDNYSVLGTIEAVQSLTNPVTSETVYEILLNCNDIVFPVMAATADVYGTPTPGMRLKANLWLQGTAAFPADRKTQA